MPNIRPGTAGILCLVGAVAVLSASDSIIKWLSPTYALHEIMLYRGCVAIPITLGFVWFEGGFKILRTRRPVLHLVRGLLLVLANMFFFLGLATLPMAEAVALFFVAPLFITALSQPVLGERVGPVRWAAVLIGIVGVIIVLRPGSGIISIAGLLPVAAAFCYAWLQMLTRRLGVTDKAATLSFYIQLCFLLVSAAVGAAIGDGRFAGSDNSTLEFLLRAWSWPSLSDHLLLFLCGALIGVGSYLLSQAYRLAEAAAVAPFEYTGMPFAVFWGYYLWGDWPDWVTFAGAALIIGGGLFVFYRESMQSAGSAYTGDSILN